MAASLTPARLIDRLRSICLALPEAAEKETWGHPTFRVRDKIFVGIGTSDDGDAVAVASMSLKAAPGEQASLLAIGHPFFMPKYVGSKGWIGVVVDADTDFDEVGELVKDSYVAIAPKALGKLVEVEA
jgi:predicted DNA-binding protein (MmcQ/YjbR family)